MCIGPVLAAMIIEDVKRGYYIGQGRDGLMTKAQNLQQSNKLRGNGKTTET